MTEEAQLRHLGIWFPKVYTGTGTDLYTVRLARALNERGIRADITWLPHYAEYLPWLSKIPKPPSWANITHVSSSLHRRFIPSQLPVVATVHLCVHNPLLTPYKSLTRRLYHRLWVRRCEAKTIASANTVTAVSQYSASLASRVFGRPDIHTIPNWIDLNNFSPDRRSSPNDPFRLLYVGNLSYRKGADLLPRMMRELGAGFQLHFTGTEGAFSENLSPPDNMTAIGRIHDEAGLVKAYQDSDALIFPTRVEGFGLVALEAQACGRPVICTDGTSLPEVVRHNVGGLLCPMDDITAFAEAARRLKEHPQLWQRMALAARRHAEKHFAESIAIDRYIAVYKRALKIGVTKDSSASTAHCAF